VCRLKCNSELINPNFDDVKKSIIVDRTLINVRIITYTIKHMKYYMITNLCDELNYSVDIIKQIYKDRWSIEEYFKYIKTYNQLDNFSETKTENIKKMLYASLIVSKLVYMITHYLEHSKMKINKHILTNGIYSSFLLKLIYGKGFTYNYLHKFFKIFILYYKIKENRAFSKICHNPHKKILF
jgi:hypothetical protein